MLSAVCSLAVPSQAKLDDERLPLNWKKERDPETGTFDAQLCHDVVRSAVARGARI